MDRRIEKDKEPTGRRHVTDPRPDDHQHARMMEGLQVRDCLALGQHDGRVEQLIEFGEIEEPAVESKPLVPESAEIRRVGYALRIHVDGHIGRGPDVRSRVVGHAVAQTARSMQLAQSIGHSGRTVLVPQTGPRVLDGLQHAQEGPSRVNRQEDVVEDDGDEEGSRLAHRPRLKAPLTVDAIEVGDRGHIDDGRSDRVRHV